MKSQKGVTLISLTIYTITMAVVIGILATVTTFFYKNVRDVNVDIDPLTQFTTFNSYFTQEINQPNLKVVKCGITESNQKYILFSNEVQYTYVPENKGVYRNNVKICNNIENCEFTESIKNGKSIITVDFNSGEKTRTIDYSLNN